ncbi:MAG: hypothetical protein V7695_04035 [Sulfitobacter sp.]
MVSTIVSLPEQLKRAKVISKPKQFGGVTQKAFPLRNLIFAGALVCLASGCENSGGVIGFVPIAIVVAPIAVPLDAAKTASSITQPVAVVSSSGQTLAGPTGEGTAAKQTFKTTRGTVRCTGKAAGGPPRVKKATVKLICTNGMRGEASFYGNLTVGFAVYASLGGAGDTSINCSGNYRASGTSTGPFLSSCKYTRREWADFNKVKKQTVVLAEHSSAVSAGATAAGGFAVTYWIPAL